MPSALEIALKFGISAANAAEIADYLDVYLEDLELDKSLERAAREASRNRVSSFTLAYMVRSDQGQIDLVLNGASDPDGLQAEYEATDPDNAFSDTLTGAKQIIDSCAGQTDKKLTADWGKLVFWIEAVLRKAGRRVDYNYLAVRLLISLPEAEMGDYPKIISPLLNKAKHRGYLDGWFTLEETDGKKKTFYHPKGGLPVAIISDATIARYAKIFPDTDPIKLTGFISFKESIDYAAIFPLVAIWLENRKKEFDL